MGRITKRDKEGVAFWNGTNGLSYSDNKGNIYGEAISKLADYEDAEEQGLLLRLPCKIGDRVYWIDDYEIYDDRTNNFEIRKENGEYIFCIAWMDFKADDFGKIVFLTREEAETKLEEMGK